MPLTSRKPDPEAPRRPDWGRVLLAVAVLCAVFVAGLLVGRAMTAADHGLGGWQVGEAKLGKRQLLVEHDGWSYAANDGVPMWIDDNGAWHDSGWPSCLDGRAGTDLRVRFAAHKVSVEGMSWRPIVAVDCRETSPRD
ncbi:hypothetical protein [Nocardioides ferulae]|uniref:hypothetical protein n=1 Tax=Nocardioides ferulae TaxID=2340821 RepID=UPI000F891AC0|nr:hypothetical protein [Nocardioides ferulae]